MRVPALDGGAGTKQANTGGVGELASTGMRVWKWKDDCHAARA